MATVATVVISGKCQNSHTMVAADSARIAKSAATFVRACDTSVMPFPPDRASTPRLLIQVALLNDHIVKTLIFRRHRPESLDIYPSMVSRRQCRAVNTMSSSARASEAAADTPTSSAATGSSLRTLVINKCWLKEGMNISELRVFSE